MKKVVSLLGFIALLVVSCNKQDVGENVQVPEGKYLFTIRADQSIATKTTYSGDKTFHWGTKDKISVLFHNTVEPFDNKFYTLSYVSEADGKASFSGVIDDGYEVGAADGEHKKWALYPASDYHRYAAGDNPITFHIPEVTDFTASGAEFSANIPMVAVGNGSNQFTFSHMCGAYKFVFEDIDPSVTKVRLTVENQNSRALSGDIPTTGSSAYLANSSSGTNSISFVENVSGEHTATFYVPYRGWHADFKPILTLKNEANSYVLLEKKAKVAYESTLGSSVSHIVVTKAFSASGTGVAPFVPLIEIDGDMSDWDPASNDALTANNYKSVLGGGTYWKEFKVAYDTRYIYFYMKRNYNAALWDLDGSAYSGYFWFKFDTDKDEDYEDNIKFYIRPFTKVSEIKSFVSSAPAQSSSGTSGSVTLSVAGLYDASDVVIEARASRSDIGLNKDASMNILSNANKNAGDIVIKDITFEN